MSEETDNQKQVGLQKMNESQKRKLSKETNSTSQIRKMNNRLCQQQRRARKISQTQDTINQNDFLKTFDTSH